MQPERTFLERLAGRSPQDRPSDRTGQDVHALMDSVRRHLNRLLNSRHGMSEALGDYGLPALGDMVGSGGDPVRVVGEAIKTAIEKYEPRLRRVRVTCDESPGPQNRQKLVFRIEATLVGRGQEHRVWYETSLNGGGGFDVAG